MANYKRTNRDHTNIDTFLEGVLDDYKEGVLTKGD
jgi:hypothetical protein